MVYADDSCNLSDPAGYLSGNPEVTKRIYTRINKLAKEEDNSGEVRNSTPNNWYIGPNNRNVGSIHSDFIVSYAADLCESNYVAVYPVGGWWKERPYLNRTDNIVRYALIVSLETSEIETDLYTPIITRISTSVPVSIPIAE